MINHKKILCVVPARGGSKGVTKKNIRRVAGKPLIIWTMDEAKKSKYIDRLIVSTDDSEIQNIISEHGYDAPFRRPAELSTDSSNTIDVVIHALDNISACYDYVVLLQPTCPLRSYYDIDHCIETCCLQDVSSVVSVTKVDKPPHWIYNMDDVGKLSPFLKTEKQPLRRQDSMPLYQLNGSIYVNKVSDLRSEHSFINNGTVGYVMPHDVSLDIDTELDLKLAEILLQSRQELNWRQY